MKNLQPSRLIALLFTLLFAAASPAQETSGAATPVAPDFNSLQTNWWSYFEGPREEAEPRVAEFLRSVQAGIANLEVQNQAIAESVLVAARDNIAAYLVLLDDTELAPQELPPLAINYSIDELLNLAALARAARAEAAEEQLEVEREQRVRDGASRRRDAAFRDYVGAAPGDERWLAALRLLRVRSALATSTRRLDLLTQRQERATRYATAVTDRVVLARGLLAATTESTELSRRVQSNQNAVESARDELRAAQIAASGLDVNTVQGRSQQRLQQQRLWEAEVHLALAEVALANSDAQYWWTLIQLNAAPDIALIEGHELSWSELIRNVGLQAPGWKRDTEDELLAVQTVPRDELDRESRRLLDQRLGTAQETIADITALDAAVADLELLTEVIDTATAEYSGALRSWWTRISRNFKTASSRLSNLADVTLFSVGETPVAGGDILRFIIIMVVAILLSRGVQHAIGRVAAGQNSGTQASLYTVGRLTHYAVIIIALFIGLSSIGLDFGNLALVAGALSVGIGFGLQSIVNNFVSGLIILFEHTLRVGDYIELEAGLTGTVKAINVRSTLINTNDNIDIVVPNSEFVSSRLTNWTLGERTLRVRVPFGVAYGTDKELVKKAALEAAAEVSYTLTNMKERETDVWLVEFGDNSLNFLLLVWVNRQGAKRPTRTRAAYLWALDTKLHEYGIEIPFPQRDLHLRSGWPPPSPASSTGRQSKNKGKGLETPAGDE
ncbi:MAG: mechanosensitive ion channel [Proteobacteria bacterium]|nr:mechanosensitive ion channel [Pseudomonadota bacterium]MDA0992036.1 mechanosensitive ion channel [Pseudomonadota bacterium]